MPTDPDAPVPRNEDYHAWLRCDGCQSGNIHVWGVEGTQHHEYILRECRNCGRRWTTIARFETSRITREGVR